MKRKYISGQPPDLEKTLEDYSDHSKLTNISRKRIQDSVVGYTLSDGKWPGTNLPMSHQLYCFFPKN